MKFVILTDDAEVIGPFPTHQAALGRLEQLKVYSNNFQGSDVVSVTGIRDVMKAVKKQWSASVSQKHNSHN